MQVTIDLNQETPESMRRVIAALMAYSKPDVEVRVDDDVYKAAMSSLTVVPFTPKPVEVAAPSTVAATASPIVQEAVVVFSPPLPNVPTPPAPPAVPAPPAPSAPVLPTPPASAVDVDSEGLPWDARIHASTKTKTQAGIWKKRKGLADDVDQDAIKRELLDVMAIPSGSSAPTPPATATDTAGPTTLAQLMPRVTAAMLAKSIPATALLEAVAALGLPSIPSLAQRPDMIPQVWDMLVAQYPVLAQ